MFLKLEEIPGCRLSLMIGLVGVKPIDVVFILVG